MRPCLSSWDFTVQAHGSLGLHGCHLCSRHGLFELLSARIEFRSSASQAQVPNTCLSNGESPLAVSGTEF